MVAFGTAYKIAVVSSLGYTGMLLHYRGIGFATTTIIKLGGLLFLVGGSSFVESEDTYNKRLADVAAKEAEAEAVRIRELELELERERARKEKKSIAKTLKEHAIYTKDTLCTRKNITAFSIVAAATVTIFKLISTWTT